MNVEALQAFLEKLGQDPALRTEFAELASRYGITLGSDELSEEALGQVAGGLAARTVRNLSTVEGEASDDKHKKWIEI